MAKGITVFTPVYNRAYCIKNLYNSLKCQSYINFEWIVVDDGSSDNLAETLEKWIQEENKFDIIYVKVQNGGKMRAFNKGVRLASAPAFFIVDSDDYLTDDALEFLNFQFQKIQNNNSFAGISGLRKIKTIDADYDFDYVDATNLERRKYNLVIDMAECYKTEVLKAYPALEIENEKYLSPSYVWNSIAQAGYKLRWFNKVIYIAEYRKDGLSAEGPDIRTRNPIGWGRLIQLNVNCKKDIQYIEFQYYEYYRKLKENFSLETIAKYLGIDSNYLNNIIAKKPAVIEKINAYFYQNKIKKVALYGLGGEAKRFLDIIEEIDIDISYGIDRCPNSILKICYKPTDKLPDVDAILITNRAGITGIKNALKEYTSIRCISLQDDLVEKGLNYYFSDI